MKIEFFAINNFRGISGGLDSNKIVFHDTNTLFIYGQNNVGKSTFLKAYEFLYNDATPVQDDFNRRETDKSIEFEIEVCLDESDRARIEANAPKQKDSYKKYVKDDRLRIKKIWKKNDKKIESINQTYDYASGKYETIGYASIGLHSVFKSCMPRPVFIKAMPNEEEAKSILNEILKLMAEGALKDDELEALKAAREKIKELQDKMYNHEIVSSYESSVNEYFGKIFKGTSIAFKEQKDRLVWTENKLGKEFDIEFQKLTSTGEIDAAIPANVDKIGHGTIRTAIFTLLLMKDVAEKFVRKVGRKDYMVLFEEPELFLYPKMVKQLRELIYQVSEEDLPYQVLCASHSAAMIDLSKPKSSIIRLVDEGGKTSVYQINDKYLKDAKGVRTDVELRQEMFEVLRFNPFICESFYSDEVLLVEGPTEEIIARAFFQETDSERDIFILNCGTVNNIPFYQKIFSKFHIRYHVIFDTDKAQITSRDSEGNPTLDSGIQKSICDQFVLDKTTEGKSGLLRVHTPTFEPAHRAVTVHESFRFPESSRLGKPFDANMYWKTSLQSGLGVAEIDTVPIIKYLKEIVGHRMHRVRIIENI